MQRLDGASRRWLLQGAARAFGRWAELAEDRRLALKRLHRGVAAILLRGLRLCMNKWCSYSDAQLQACPRYVALHSRRAPRVATEARLLLR